MSITSRLRDLAETALLTEAEVIDVEPVGDDFVRLGLHSFALRSMHWSAGAKVQIRLPIDGRGMRTYTPLNWDFDDGSTALLAYRHDNGPAGMWCGQVEVGDRIRFLGPRRSIEAPAPGEHVLFVGDETSVALAVAFATTSATVTHLFEAVKPESLAGTLRQLSLASDAAICGAFETDTLLDRLRTLAAAMATPYRLVVTGNANTVHVVRRDVRAWTSPPAKIIGKAYWAAGRTGLD